MIHRTAIIDQRAEIESGVDVGPFAVIEAGVRVGKNSVVGPHAHLQGPTVIGPNNVIGTGCCIGLPPQHIEYKGAPSRLVIGSGNTFREFVTVHRAYKEEDETAVGDNCFIMAYCHIAHDCRVADRVIMANCATLGGHVTVGERAFLSGFVGVHQFCRVGRLAMVGGTTKVTQDVPPFVIADGNPASVRALNTVGLQRAGLSVDTRKGLKQVFRHLYRSGKTVRQALEEMQSRELSAESRDIIEFYSTSKRGVLAYGRRRTHGEDEE
jgi:UDP-N-acetylglucosamine acyltransferase